MRKLTKEIIEDTVKDLFKNYRQIVIVENGKKVYKWIEISKTVDPPLQYPIIIKDDD